MSGFARHTVAWIAAKDAASELLMTSCTVLALVAVLAPLLILFSLKFGLIDTMAQRLIEDVRNREVVIISSTKLTYDWFDRMRTRDDVEFVVPNTRTIAASFNSVQNRDKRKTVRGLSMIPTAAGDPLLENLAARITEPRHIVLSSLAAERLQASVGQSLRARVQRTRDNTAEAQFIELEVVGVAAPWAETEPAAFVDLELLIATEEYRDGLAVESFGWPGRQGVADERVFPRFRLYARSIYDVPGLRDALVAEHLDIRTQAVAIESMRSLDRSLSTVFAIIAAVACGGFVLALASILAANVQRKRRELSVLRLIGAPLREIVAFPITQALIVAVSGLAVSLAIFTFVSRSLNDIFSHTIRTGESISQLLPHHILVAGLATMGFAILSSLWAGVAALRIEPAEGLADV
ncbi:ABC transporter permease [Parvibaculum sp.]|uniref:ABC transporter permease n=1 Tax=Parvibaculum sp. TaxID=2024848 RepID=UPI001D920129|nr:ABC transporter permease [Parvibaculum sp.]MBX3489989.1 ABC transporter permease [Parvibaculum sp.]MCW5726023.1 ABC transporter permease [Parvibaculum sp.]